jgi:hypothetical protein
MDIIAAIRDILISVYLLVGIVLILGMLVFAYLIYRASKGLIGTVTRTAENFEKVSDAAVEHIAKPLEEGISVGSVAGNAVGFATGFVAGMRGRKSDKKDEKEESRGDGATKKKKKRRIPFL